MKITKTPPAPPAPTFTIEGLSVAELKLIAHRLGGGTGDDDNHVGAPKNTGYNLYTAINAALGK